MKVKVKRIGEIFRTLYKRCEKESCDFKLIYGTGPIDEMLEMCGKEFIVGKPNNSMYCINGFLIHKDWVDVIESPIDKLAKMPKDTRLYVSDVDDMPSSCNQHQYFKYVKNGKVYCFAAGATSWSNPVIEEAWKYFTIVGEQNNE